MQEQNSGWEIRKVFKQSESDNLFYNFTEDHRMDFLWNDDDLYAIMIQHFNDECFDKIYIQLLMQKGYFHALRCLKREKASLDEKTGLLKNIEKAIGEDKDIKNEMLAYLHSFCDAIDYYSEDEKKKMKQQGRMHSLGYLIVVVCIAILLGLTIKAVKNPESFFPIKHMYAYDFWNNKLIDIAYQYNIVKGISFYDEKGNIKAELSGENAWGTRDLTVHEPATKNAGERDVYFEYGSSVPTMITENQGENDSLAVYYKPNGKISYTADDDSTVMDNGSRYIYYSDDGTGLTVKIWNGTETRYYAASELEPLYGYTWTRVDGENEEDYQIVYRDISGELIYTNDVRCIRKGDGLIRVFKNTLGNGTIQTHYALFYDSGKAVTVFFPSEEIFTAHPESKKEYQDGRLIRETWGPTMEYQLAYYEYVYEQDILTSIREYDIPYADEVAARQYDTIPVYRREYKVNDKGHITEIISHDPLTDPYLLYLEYDDNSRIARVKVYYSNDFIGEEEPEYLYSYTCHYRSDGSLDFIREENQEGIARVDIFINNAGEIVDYEAIEDQP